MTGARCFKIQRTVATRSAAQEERRRQILEAAVRAFAKKGYHASRVSDIAGVLRLDARSSELRELEFRYIHVGRWAEGRARGLLRFERLPTGAWVINEAAVSLHGSINDACEIVFVQVDMGTDITVTLTPTCVVPVNTVISLST